MKRGLGPLMLLAGGFTLGLGAMVGTAAAVSGGQGPVALANSGAATHFDLTIATPAMLSNPNNMPAYLPSDLTLPANSDVTITIKNFDGATALAPGTEQYAKVVGVIGNTIKVSALDMTNPNATPADVQSVSSIDPSNVAHTFTVPSLGLNIPVPALSTVTFAFHTGAKGIYSWRCMDPCGTGSAGWGGPMSTMGYMQGKMHLV